MIQIEIDNRRLVGTGIQIEVGKAISDRLSYLQAGHQHIRAFRDHLWDGRRRLASVSQNGTITTPLGVGEEVVSFLTEHKLPFEIVNNRKLPDYKIGLSERFDYSQLREYQRNALRAATTPRGLLQLVGRGIVKMPPRSGKTLTAAAIISTLDVRALFIVPSTLLLYQAQSALERALGVRVGIVGDNRWEVGDVTVATVQTLVSRRGNKGKGILPTREYVQLLRNVDLLVIDECHHLSGDSEWRKVIQDSSAAYKVGLSATVFLDHERECELGVIWLRACTGEIVADVSTSDLIERGFLVRPEVRIYPVREPDFRRAGWSATLLKRAIYNNAYRNKLIVELTGQLVAEGLGVVVITNRVEQIGTISRLLLTTGLRFARMTGTTPTEERESILAAFRARKIRALVSTVLDEGVDVPEIDAIINAEGGHDVKATFQRLRCMTPAPGKSRAVVVDFMDLTNRYFARHSLERLTAYRSERAFQIKVIK